MTQPLQDDDRQDALARLLEDGERLPGVADAMKAYDEMQAMMGWRIVEVEGEVRYASGTNAP